MPESLITPSAQVLVKRLPGGAVLVHLGTNKVFELNETGAKVWELLSRGRNRREILQRLVEDFDVEPTRADTGLTEVLEQLEREGLLRSS